MTAWLIHASSDYIFWIQKNIKDVFQSLFDSKVIGHNFDCKKLIEKWLNRLTSRWIPIIGILLGFMVIAWWSISYHFISPHMTSLIWYTQDPELIPILSILNFVLAYVMVLTVINVLVITYILGKLFSSGEITVLALHPDGCGGFGKIGNYSNSLLLFMMPLGIILSIDILDGINSHWPIADFTPLFLGVFVFYIVCPILYLLSLWNVHKKMAEYRHKTMIEISNKFEDIFNPLLQSNTGAPKEFEVGIEKLKGLRDLRDLQMNIPTWPISFRQVKGFVSVFYYSPLIPVFTEIVKVLVFPTK